MAQCKGSLQGVWFRCWISVCLLFGRCIAERLYCTPDGTMVSILPRVDRAESHSLVSLIRGLERHKAFQNCRWIMDVPKTMTTPSQLIFKVTQHAVGDYQDRLKCDSILSFELKDFRSESDYVFVKAWTGEDMLPKTPLILPLTISSQVIIRFLTGALEPSPSCGSIELTIEVARGGVCGLNMLLHQSRCLFISDKKLVPSDLIGTGAELAAISGMEQLQELLKDNEKLGDAAVTTHSQPLDFSSPVRIGVFRCYGATSASYWDSSSGQCKARMFAQTAAFAKRLQSVGDPAKVQCASLIASRASPPKLQFSNCNSSMRSVLSFPSTPSIPPADAGKSCWNSIWGLCGSVIVPPMSPSDTSSAAAIVDMADRETPNHVFSSASALVSLLVLCGVLFLWLKRRCLMRALNFGGMQKA